MIQLAVNSTFLELSQNTRIPMQEVFAFDEFMTVPGEHSWRFSVPKTPANRRAFGFADVPDVVWSPATSYACTIYVDGRVFKAGKLFVESDSSTAFDVYFVGTMGALKDVIKGAKINELTQWPEISISGNMFDYADAIVSAPWALVTFGEVAMPNGDFPQTFINTTKDPASNPGVWVGFERTGVNPLVPFVFLRVFWDVLYNEFGISVAGDFLNDAEIDSLVFFNLNPLNLVDTSGAYTATFPNKISLKNHVPDMVVEEFLTNFAKLFNLLLTYDDGTKVLRFEPRKNLLALPRVPFAERVVSAKTIFEDYKTYSLRYVYDEAEKIATPDWDGTLEGVNGALDSVVVESQVSTLPMWDQGNDGEWHIPLTVGRLGEDVGVRLLFYRGLQNTYSVSPFSGPRPLLTSDVRYTTGFSYALTWKDASGLHAQWWSSWLAVMLQARTLRLVMRLTSAELAEFNPLTVWVVDHWRCFVKRLSYDLGEEGALVEVDVLKF